jgi:N utilization substance protein B
MSVRRKARAFALQMLFQWEVGRQNPQRIEDGFWRMARAEKATRQFANALFEETASGVTQLDALLATHSKNWRPERMALIDRAILRLAAQEIRSGKTPPKVVFNEAIELAKQFSSEDAASFINGILDSVWRSLEEEKKERSESR